MIDRENVIKELEEAVPFLENRGYGGIAHTVHDTLALLEEQEPVQVSQYWDDTYGDYVNACECGNNWISIDGSLVNYCPGCGKVAKRDD